MNSPAFNFRVPIEGAAFAWIKQKEDAGMNVSHAIRLLIETHGNLYDKLINAEDRIQALKRQIIHLTAQDSPDYRGHLEFERKKLQKIRREARDQSKNDS
jgi:hypothetical protein